MFAPEDLAVVRGDPSERRRLLDELVVARTPRLAGVRSDYERVLKQRAALLKSAAAARRGGDLSTLDVWDGHLVEHGSELLRARLDTVRALRPHAAAAYGQVAPASAELTLRYASALTARLPGLADRDAVPDREALQAALRDELAAQRAGRTRPRRQPGRSAPRRPRARHRGVAGPRLRQPRRGLVGRAVAAAGQLRAAAMPTGCPGGDPVLVLDDVFAELDSDRRAQLALVAAKAEQTIITAAVERRRPRSARRPAVRGRRRPGATCGD